MLDLPELLAPAKIVSGRISMLCSSLMDLNPPTVISEMALVSGLKTPLDFGEEGLILALLAPRTHVLILLPAWSLRSRPARGERLRNDPRRRISTY